MKLRELARDLDAELRGEGDREITTLSSLSSADGNSLTFLANPKYREAAAKSGAGAILCSSPEGLGEKTLLLHPNPYAAWARALELFYPPKSFPAGIHPTAVIGDGTSVSGKAYIGPYAVVGNKSRIEDGATVEAGCVIGDNCVVGRGARLFPRVVLYDSVEIGERSVLHSGVVVGSDGFGYAEENGRIRKVPQVGRVVVESDVEIGANTTIDRGALEKTVIGAGSKIDNLCQIAHNVKLGKSCVIIAQSGISGSAELGDGVIMSGQSGAVGHIKIGSFSRIGAKSAVTKDVPEKAHFTGIPAQDHRKWLRERALIQKIGRIYEALKKREFFGTENDDD